MFRLAASALLIVFTVLMTGCRGTFEASVANQSSHPVDVRLTYTKWYGSKEVLLQERLAPGDATRLGPIDAPAGRARLEATPLGISSPRAALVIKSGETTAHVIGVFLDRGIPGVDWRVIETDRN
ncbi:MAG: hypothetical protein Phyf2KO_24180 [Phycisphaerales bacterium]